MIFRKHIMDQGSEVSQTQKNLYLRMKIFQKSKWRKPEVIITHHIKQSMYIFQNHASDALYPSFIIPERIYDFFDLPEGSSYIGKISVTQQEGQKKFELILNQNKVKGLNNNGRNELLSFSHFYLHPSQIQNEKYGMQVSNYSLIQEQNNILRLENNFFEVVALNSKSNYSQKVLQYCEQKLGTKKFTQSLSNPCRICLLEEQNPQDRLISPCQCKGGCSSIHLNCLQYWIKTNTLIEKDENCVYYKFKKINCEICKSPFPAVVNIDGKKKFLFNIQQAPSPNICLRLYSQKQLIFIFLKFNTEDQLTKQKPQEKDYYFSNKYFPRFGFIRSNNKLYLKDFNSKHQSFVFTNRKMMLQGTKQIRINDQVFEFKCE